GSPWPRAPGSIPGPRGRVGAGCAVCDPRPSSSPSVSTHAMRIAWPCVAMATVALPRRPIVAIDCLTRKSPTAVGDALTTVDESGAGKQEGRGERKASGRRGEPRRMVVQIRAAGGRTVRGIRLAMVYLDDRGELPDDDQQARLRRHFEAAFRELTGQS